MLKFKSLFPLFLSIMVGSLIFASCGFGSRKIQTVSQVKESYTVKGINFRMVEFPGVAFEMGTRPDGRLLLYNHTLHEVVLDGFAISEYPINQELWKAVMGDNPSAVKGDDYPVDKVSLKDCMKFAEKLSKLTGVPFYIPTEAQWEYAVNSGKVKYLANTREWCWDSYTDSPTTELEINPRTQINGDKNVIRTDSQRDGLANYTKAPGVTFRLAVYTDKKCDKSIINAIVDEKPQRDTVCKNEVIEVNGVKIDMIGVKGGTFEMGATPEQGNYAEEDEKPEHEVKVADFEIASKEVSVGLWKAVMGSLPYGNSDKDTDKPVVNISWYKAQEFILELNRLTGRKFRLPTEAEWEYAARGGDKSKHYRFSGSNQLASVGAYAENTGSEVQNEGKYQKNEIGIYDMSGNVWEWCQDKFAFYGKQPEKGDLHIMRGGSASSRWYACRVSNRSKIPASNVKDTFGFRLAL